MGVKKQQNTSITLQEKISCISLSQSGSSHIKSKFYPLNNYQYWETSSVKLSSGNNTGLEKVRL